MNGTVLARLAAAVFLTIAIVVAVIESGRQGEEARASRPVADAPREPFREGLQRCQALGEAALEDRSCLALWVETRRRFLTTGPASDESE